jgi:protein SCO1/2
MPTGSLRPRRLAPALLLVALALGSACKPAEPKSFNPEGLSGPKPNPPIPKPEFVLTDTDGKPYDFQKETNGKITLLFFGYTNCPDVCPVHLTNIAAALQTLSPEVNQAIKVVFVTTDPARDTPEVMRKWLDHFNPAFVGLRGDTTTVAAIMQQTKVGPILVEQGPKPGSYGIGHSTLVLAFTRDNLAHVFYPFGIRQSDWAKDLQLLAER